MRQRHTWPLHLKEYYLPTTFERRKMQKDEWDVFWAWAQDRQERISEHFKPKRKSKPKPQPQPQWAKDLLARVAILEGKVDQLLRVVKPL